MAHVGFYDENIGMYELHSNIFVVAKDAKLAKLKVENKKIFIEKNMHIDGIQEILYVDGYEITLTRSLNIASNKIFNYDSVKKLNSTVGTGDGSIIKSRDKE